MQHVDYIDTKPQEGTKRGRVRAQVSFFHGLLLIVLEYDTALTWLMIVESYNGTLALLPWEIHSGISPVWRHFHGGGTPEAGLYYFIFLMSTWMPDTEA